MNPTDLWAWAGLVGDAVDLIPVVSGVGEASVFGKNVSVPDPLKNHGIDAFIEQWREKMTHEK